MALTLALGLLSAQLAAAAPEAQITAPAHLQARETQTILGFVSTSGASVLTDLRSCDFPATLTTSGSYMQCCDPSLPCDFFTTCSGGVLRAEKTSVTCDWGFCNTGLVVPTAGAKDRKSVLGCWATDIGEDAFELVQDRGSATPDPTAATSASDASNTSSESESSDVPSTTGSSPTSTPSGTSSPAPNAPGTAASGIAKPILGFVGVLMGLAFVM